MLKKWWEVYNGDAEKRFFVGKDGKSGLIRNTDFDWRTTKALSRESGLTEVAVESIIDKYHKAGIIVQHTSDPEKWGYWEKVAPQLASATKTSVADDDKKKRVEKAKKA